MTSARFDLSSTLKNLDLSLFRFFEWSGFQNHEFEPYYVSCGSKRNLKNKINYNEV